jgi:hypothetical protein
MSQDWLLSIYSVPIPAELAIKADLDEELNYGAYLAARAVTPQSPCFSPVWRSSLLEFLAGFGDIFIAGLAVLAWALERLGELVGV